MPAIKQKFIYSIFILSFLFIVNNAFAFIDSMSQSAAGGIIQGQGSSGGGSFYYNDLLNYGSSSSRTLNFSVNEHNNYFMGIKSKDGVEVGRSLPIDNGKINPSGFVNSYMQNWWNDVYIGNKCAVDKSGQVQGTNCRASIQEYMKSPKLVGQVHPPSPNAGVSTTKVGTPQQAIVRIWRECRGELKERTQRTQIENYNGKSTCSQTPIYERVSPATEFETPDNRDEYLYSRWENDNYKTTSSANNSSLNSISNPKTSAGLLYLSCSSSDSYKIIKYCKQAGYHKSDSGSLNNKCDAGGITSDKRNAFNKAEMSAELEYLVSIDSKNGFWKKNRAALNKWIEEGRYTNSFPFSSSESKNKICQRFTEWVAVNWSGLGGSGSRTNITVNFSGIPGRIYIVQIVILDSKQSIIEQRLGAFTAPARLVPPTQNFDCSDPRHPDYNPPYLTPPCEPAQEEKIFTFSNPTDGGSGIKCPQSIFINTPGKCLLTGNDSSTSQTDDQIPSEPNNTEPNSSNANMENGSIWFPRALKAGVYNYVDASKNDPKKSLEDTHINTKVKDTDIGLDYTKIGNDDTELPGGYPRDMLLNQIPVFATATYGLTNSFDTYMNRATSVLKNDEDRVEQFQKEDARYLIGLGENKRLRGRGSLSSHTVGGNNAIPYNYDNGFHPLTSGHCKSGANNPLFAGFDANGFTDWNSPQSCNGSGLNQAGIGPNWNWKASDAYYLPRVVKSGESVPRNYATTLFSQDQEGDARIKLMQPAGGDDLNSRIHSIEIWKAEDYASDAEDKLRTVNYDGQSSKPEYMLIIGNDPNIQNTYATDGEIRFCKATKEVDEKRTITIQKYPFVRDLGHAIVKGPGAWNMLSNNNVEDVDPVPNLSEFKSGYGENAIGNPDSELAYYTEAKYPGDTLFVRFQGDTTLYRQLDNRRPDSKIGDNYELVWGREWWNHNIVNKGKVTNTDVGVNDIAHPDNRVAGNANSATYKLYNKYRTVPVAKEIDVIVTRANQDCAEVPEDELGVRPKNSDQRINIPSTDERLKGYRQARQYNESTNRYDKPVETLEKGLYIVRYNFVYQTPFNGAHWGIEARLTRNPNFQWINGFSNDINKEFVSVFDSRAAG